MFGWFKKKAAQVADSMRSHLDTMRLSWENIGEEYRLLLDQTDSLSPEEQRMRLQQSTMGENLKKLVTAVVAESNQSAAPRAAGAVTRSPGGTDDTMSGPCFEFLLDRKVIHDLCAMGIPNQPAGMRTLITRHLDLLFMNIKKPLLPNMSVHVSMRQFMTVCVRGGDLQRESSKSTFLSLLRTLCLKLREDPQLAWVFFEQADARQLSRSQALETPTEPEHEFMIFTTLLTLINDRDAFADSAIEGILACVQLADPEIANWVANKTAFPRLLVEGLVALFHELPSVVETQQGADNTGDSDDGVANETLPLTKEFHLFWTRLDLIEVVAQSTFPVLSQAVGNCFRVVFLENALTPRLLHVEEKVIKWATVYMRKIVERVRSDALQSAIMEFLLGDVLDEPETYEEEKVQPMRATIIKRIDGLNEEVSVATLGLFEAIANSHHEHAYTNLMLRNFRDCRHIVRLYRPEHRAAKLMGSIDLESMVASFERLENLHRDPSFPDYLLDAQHDANVWAAAYARWSIAANKDEVADAHPELDPTVMPASPAKVAYDSIAAGGRFMSYGAGGASLPDLTAAGSESADEGDEQPGGENDEEEEEIYEGLFLTSLFLKLENIYSNSFTTNLRLTSLLSTLAGCPNPVLHSYFLNPHLPQLPNVHTLLDTLRKVWNEGRERADNMPNFELRLREAQKQLNSEQYVSTTMESRDVQRFLRGVIVLQEFMKELLAIARAKMALQDLSINADMARQLMPKVPHDMF